jgi:hypothetical protein
MIKRRLLPFALLLSLLGAFVIAPVADAARPATSTASFPITANLLDSTGATVGSLVGAVSNLAVANQGGQLTVSGILNGTATNTLTGDVVNIVNQAFTTTLTANGTCPILHLTIGPIDLNLLGLVVHTDQIVLNIDAQSGPGNLLGNLLCAVAHLLDSNASGNALANLLNQILGLLG